MRKDRRVRKEDYSRQRMVQRKIEKLAQINKEERVNCLKKEEMKQVNISKLNIPKARFGIIKMRPKDQKQKNGQISTQTIMKKMKYNRISREGMSRTKRKEKITINQTEEMKNQSYLLERHQEGMIEEGILTGCCLLWRLLRLQEEVIYNLLYNTLQML